MTLQQKLEFRATLERMKSSLGWVIIRVPIDVSKAWGTRGQTRVRVQVNGAEFRTSLFPSGTGQHYMIVNKQMQRAGGQESAPPPTSSWRKIQQSESSLFRWNSNAYCVKIVR